MKRSQKYLLSVLIFVIIALFILSNTDLKDNISLSISIQAILIIYMTRVLYVCILYIRSSYEKKKYSYSIIMNLGLVLFLFINIVRSTNLLIANWDSANIIDIYNNTLASFSYFAMLTLPCIIVISIYSIITNIILIKKEGFTYRNLLGIVLGAVCLVGLFGEQVIFEICKNLPLNSEELLIKKFIDLSLNATLSYFYCVIIATLYCNIKAAKHNPAYDKDFVIILGARVNKDGTLTKLLKGRVDRAIKFAKEQEEITHKKIIYVPSGGQGSDETISEAEAIKNYLLSQGIEEKYILIENKSTSTIENMRFSKDKINKKSKNAKIAFSTTNYHVFRSGIIAYNEGLVCEGMGSKTKWYFYTNALIREFIANLVSERRKHILLIIIINLFLFALTCVGYFNKFYLT